MKKISQVGINLIKQFEGLSLKAYKCPAGVWTIGWGATGKDIIQGLEWTQEQCDERLVRDLSPVEDHINRRIREIAQNKFDALVSFTYNLGRGSLDKSTLLKKVLNNPNDITIFDEFMKWTYAGGKQLQGLIRRRKAEADLYFT